jgi:CheY-like chemotaxis protein
MKHQSRILWVDDEIDLLKSYIIFLEEKGFELSTATNGEDAIEICRSKDFDLVFLDENMPGLSGIETLKLIKEIKPFIPVVMITKSEEEDIMEQAIGSKIADYLIKPVNPNQILLSIKKNMDTRRLINEKVSADYQSQFSQISMAINSARGFSDWVDIYKRLVYWELGLSDSNNSNMDEVLIMQKTEANKEFSRFIERNYESWFDTKLKDKPLLSPNIFQKKIFPLLDKGEKVFFLLIDNLRYDQWKTIEEDVTRICKSESEEIFCGILPTATQYARNAMFAGLMPYEINELYPEYWVWDEEEEGKNLKEKELFEKQLARNSKNYRFKYEKVTNQRSGKKLIENYRDMLNYDLNIIVYNFVDMLSHARTDMEMIRELADNEAAYRSLTASWFGHSQVYELLRLLQGTGVKVVITTDHGSIRVQNPVKVIAEKKASSNLRYKVGRNLNYEKNKLFEVSKPENIHLPKPNISASFIFAHENDYFVYPNNYNHFVNYYKNTFQHGGISMEEMLIPFIILNT